MILDKKGKLFGKINLVDISVILIIIIAVAATYFKFNLSAHSDVTRSDAEVIVTLRATGVRDFTVDAYEVGDKVYDDESGKYVGEIVEKTTTEAKDHLTKTDGTVSEQLLPERSNLIIKVKSSALVREDGVVLESGKQVYLNQENVYCTQTAQTQFETVEIQVK